MILALQFFKEPLIARLGWTLFHFLWQGAAIATLTAVTLGAFRCRAQTRYTLYCLGLLLCLACPIVTFLTLSGSGTPELIVPKMELGKPIIGSNILTTSSESSDSSYATKVTPVKAVDRFSSLQTFFLQQKETLYTHIETWIPWFVLLWMVGVILLSGKLLTEWGILQRRRHDAIPLDASIWIECLDVLTRRLGVTRPVRLFQSAIAVTPQVIGWLQPAILLPASVVTGLSMWQIELILAHELAHIRRNDYLVNLLQTAAETLLFYHPAVWWISRRIREEREHCCDDLVVEIQPDRLAYAKVLMDLASRHIKDSQLATSASGGSLFQRIKRLLNPSTLPEKPGFRRAGFSIFIGILLITGGIYFYISSIENKPAKDISYTVIPNGDPDHLPFNEIQGNGGGGAFEDLPPNNSLFVGLRISTGRHDGRDTVASLQPIYRSGSGIFYGSRYGYIQNEVVEVLAPDGYAVSGLKIKTGMRVDGLSIFFSPLPSYSKSRKTIESKWFGGHGGSPYTAIREDGVFATGLTGRAGVDLDALGLLSTAATNKFIIGKVTDPKGSPVEQAQVCDLTTEKSISSNKDGIFIFPLSINKDQGLLIATKGAAKIGWVNVADFKPDTSADESPSANIVLQSIHALKGKLTDETGKPLQNAPLYLKSIATTSGLKIDRGNVPSKFWGRFAAHTDANGEFEIPAPANSHVTISLQGPLSGYTDFSLQNIDTNRLDLGTHIIKPAGDIRGRAIDKETGKPIAQVRILALKTLTKENPLHTDKFSYAITDQDGRFSISDLDPGKYDVQVYSPDPARPDRIPAMPTQITVEKGKTGEVDAFMVQGYLVTGQILRKDTGKPVSKKYPICFKPGPYYNVIWSETDGRFTAYFAQGHYDLEIGGNPPMETIPITVTQGHETAPVIFHIPNDNNVEIKGVFHAKDGKPITAYSAAHLWTKKNIYFGGAQGPDFFTFSPVEKGLEARLIIDAPGYALWISPPFVTGDNMPKFDITLESAPVVTVSGRVIDNITGQPFSSSPAIDYIKYADDGVYWTSALHGESGSTDTNGNFKLAVFRPGDRFKIAIYHKEESKNLGTYMQALKVIGEPAGFSSPLTTKYGKFPINFLPQGAIEIKGTKPVQLPEVQAQKDRAAGINF